MPATGSAWSRSEWLRRLGYKTGSEPPIASAIQPTLRSGDASELLPPLLAPQGWGGGYAPAVAGAFSGFQVHARAVGGCFVDVDCTKSFGAWLETSPRGTWSGTPRALYEEIPTVVSTVEWGSDTGGMTVDVPWFEFTNSHTFLKPTFYVPSGTLLYILHNVQAIEIASAIHVRDVPVGLAPD